MRTAIVVAVLALVASALAVPSKDEGVYVLTDSNFNDFVNNEEIVLVEFYAPWCGHCKKLAPEYAKAAQELANDEIPIPLAKVDATEEKDVASRFGVSGYPTIKVFRNGNPSDYNGPREAKGIMSYMRKQVGPSSHEMSSVEALEAFNKKHPLTYVGFFLNKNVPEYKAFMKAADQRRDNFKFAHTVSSEVTDHFGYRSAVVGFRSGPFYVPKYDDAKVILSSDDVHKDSEIVSFADKNSLALVGLLNEDSSSAYRSRNLPFLMIVLDKADMDTNAKTINYYLNRVRKVAVQNKEKMSFALASKEDFPMLEKFGLGDAKVVDKYVGIILDDIPNGGKYKMDAPFSLANVENFVKDFFAGKLEQFIKSEPIPEPRVTSGVTTLVGKTFQEEIVDSKDDALVEFYAPWCGHCKALAPKYDELGEMMSKYSGVKIAKIDATANDAGHSAFQVQGFPTLFFVSGSTPEQRLRPVKYEGEREAQAMFDWIKGKSKTMKKKSKNDEL